MVNGDFHIEPKIHHKSLYNLAFIASFQARKKPVSNGLNLNGGGKEGRTPDLCNAIATLYQLSYTPKGHTRYYTQF